MVTVFIAEGFEEIEAITCVDLLRRAGISVQTVGVGSGIVRGAHGVPLICDSVDGSHTLEGLSAVVLPGGMPGAANLNNSRAVREALSHANGQGLVIGAICAAPLVLGSMGLLEGKNATCFPGFEETMSGAKPSEAPVVRDGNIVTGKGPGAAIPFALELITALAGKEKAKEVQESLQCQN